MGGWLVVVVCGVVCCGDGFFGEQERHSLYCGSCDLDTLWIWI